MNKDQCYNYDKAMRLKELLREDKRREFYRAVALQELDRGIPDRPRELRPDFRPHKAQWSEVVKHAFAGNVFKKIAP